MNVWVIAKKRWEVIVSVTITPRQRRESAYWSINKKEMSLRQKTKAKLRKFQETPIFLNLLAKRYIQ
jgi:hypothetical protein